MNAPRIVGMGTALPPHAYTQEQVKERAAVAYRNLPDIERMLKVYDSAGVETRYAPFPIDWYLTPRPFGERNALYIEKAVELGEQALTVALQDAGIQAGDLDAIYFTTTTGLSTPSIDARLAHRMGMRPDVRRMPLFGLGCAAGAAGLGMAGTWAQATGGTVAVLSIELCTLTLLTTEVSKVNVIGTALFGDGAAAAIVSAREGVGRPDAPRVVAHESHQFPESEHLMGWDFSEKGFGLRLDPAVPSLVAEVLPPVVDAFLGRHQLTRADMDCWALHPGGRQVLAGYRRGLKLRREDVEASAEVLRTIGNLSSATVLFVLNTLMRTRSPLGRCFVNGMGPAFAAECVLVDGT